jgi:hypothetical protein
MSRPQPNNTIHSTSMVIVYHTLVCPVGELRYAVSASYCVATNPPMLFNVTCSVLCHGRHPTIQFITHHSLLYALMYSRDVVSTHCGAPTMPYILHFVLLFALNCSQDVQTRGRDPSQPLGVPTSPPTGPSTGKPTSPPTGPPTGQPTAPPTGPPTGQPTSPTKTSTGHVDGLLEEPKEQAEHDATGLSETQLSNDA